MPSGITHILLTRNIPYKRKDLDLDVITSSGSTELAAGCVGPDLPYASMFDDDLILSWQDRIADHFHFTSTNQIPIQAFKHIKEVILPEKNDKKRDKHFCFFSGYTSHIIADSIFHPFVMDKVGRYAANKTDHRALEIAIDVLLFKHFSSGTGVAVSAQHSEIEDVFTDFLSRGFTDSITDQFASHINGIYTENVSRETIKSWYTGIYRLFDISSGNWPSWVTKLPLTRSIFMPRLSQLQRNRDDYLVLTKPDEWDSNFLNRSRIHFIEDCIPKYNSVMLAFLRKAYAYIFKDGPPLTDADLPNVNLDTGRLMTETNPGKDITETPVYWS